MFHLLVTYFEITIGHDSSLLFSLLLIKTVRKKRGNVIIILNLIVLFLNCYIFSGKKYNPFKDDQEDHMPRRDGT